MRVALALYAEGDTDDRFLTAIIQRTTRKILTEHRSKNFTIVPVEPIKLSEMRATRAENILQAARQAFSNQALIIHSDADHPSRVKAFVDRINPGLKLVEQSNEAVCEKVLPIIPVQAIEAWILADYQLLRTELRTDLSARDLGIPERAKQVNLSQSLKTGSKQLLQP